MRKSEWLRGVAFVCLLAALPFLGHWARRGAPVACAHDGAAIDPLYRVRVIDAGGTTLDFCGIACAENWLRSASKASPASSRPRAILVVDELTGAELDADDAYFVRSLVVTNATTGNRIHAFKSKTAAEHHARSLSGRLLEDDERPFR